MLVVPQGLRDKGSKLRPLKIKINSTLEFRRLSKFPQETMKVYDLIPGANILHNPRN